MKCLVFGLLALSALPGCVTTKEAKRRVEKAVFNERANCVAQSVAKDERLKKFNQLNDDGSLR